MKKFNIPNFYKSQLISNLKNLRKENDKLKKDFLPSILKTEKVHFYIARHFGFCYGVENAIEIAFKTIAEHPDKKIYFLSEMIHNPQVNKDLIENGIQFIFDTEGKKLLDWDTISKDDIVLIPAFGTTLEIEKILIDKGMDVVKYNTTCPFVEKVWNRSQQIGSKGYSIIIHGKPSHEETKATFSHASQNAPSLIIKDMEEAKKLSNFILNDVDEAIFFEEFKGRYSIGFNPKKDLQQIGVVNQTTMLATETQAISDFLKLQIKNVNNLSEENLKNNFADTRDTLCYATNDNQRAVIELLEQKADLAIVVGGYNSSNTSHLVELCEEKLPTYYIKDDTEIFSESEIQHFNFHKKEMMKTENFLNFQQPIKILITSGASCPDTIVEKVLFKIASFFESEKQLENAFEEY